MITKYYFRKKFISVIVIYLVLANLVRKTIFNGKSHMTQYQLKLATNNYNIELEVVSSFQSTE